MSTRTTFHLPTRTKSTRKQEKKSVTEPKKEKKKRRKKLRNDNENECSMKYLDHFLMSTKTTFHLPI